MRYRESAWDKAVYFMIRDRIPVTKTLILLNILTLFLTKLFQLEFLVGWLAFNPATFIARPWTALTYPFVWDSVGIISLLFAGYWLWVAGGSLERAWGSVRFAVFFLAMSAISALGLFVGVVLWNLLRPMSMFFPGASGLWFPLAGVTVAFGMMNPEQVILFMFFIPLKLKYLALIDAAIVFFSYVAAPVVAVFALSGCAFAYWYVRVGASLSSYRSAPPRPRQAEVIRVFSRRRRFPNPLAWMKERRERRKLKDFFDKSGFKE